MPSGQGILVIAKKITLNYGVKRKRKSSRPNKESKFMFQKEVNNSSEYLYKYEFLALGQTGIFQALCLSRVNKSPNNTEMAKTYSGVADRYLFYWISTGSAGKLNFFNKKN